MKREKKTFRGSMWILPLLALAPLQIGAKGCDVGVVGNEGCPEGATSAECNGSSAPACGGLAGLECSSGAYCDYPTDARCGAADATGVCRSIPEQCTLEYSPVCGCDDETYGNACAAAMAGVSVAHAGECESGGPSGEVCDGLLGLACGEGEFCNYPPDASCGAADATGICTPQPEACRQVYLPVCGCDDKTYGNECEAHAAGVSVASEGECAAPPQGQSCGGLVGAGCARGQFCNYPVGALCGAADATGVCESPPEACDLQYEPVCGCDGRTYGNSCAAAMQGVSVQSLGECP